MNRLKFHRSFLSISVAVCLLSAGGCDFIYGLLHKEGAEEKEIIGSLDVLEPNPQVERVQALLKIYGYNIGTPDGILGTNTRIAIGKFQEDNDLAVTRFVDKATWEKLLENENNGLIKHGKLSMKDVQTALKNAGFDPGPIDGYGGKKTQDAIKAFQDANGLKPDGRVGLKTMKELAQHLPAQE